MQPGLKTIRLYVGCGNRIARNMVNARGPVREDAACGAGLQLVAGQGAASAVGLPAATQALADDVRALLSVPVVVSDAVSAGAALVFETGRLAGDQAWQLEPLGGAQWVLRARDADTLVAAAWQLPHRLLDVPPLRGFLGLPYGEAVSVPFRPLRGRVPRIPFRGWFINDEDHLSGWRSAAGTRPVDYLFYGTVMNRTVSRLLAEAALRAGLNLLIPSSFLDVEVPADAETVREAAARGLWLTQHHIEPLGVSYYAFGAYHRRRGSAVPFSYRDHPEAFDAVWRHYVRRWQALTGGRVIWQLGLRANRDAAVHTIDPRAPKGPAEAGAFMSRVVDHQLRLLREETGAAEPPATFTLWASNLALYLGGHLRLPESVTLVFSNNAAQGNLPDPVRTLPRQPGRATGFYHHCGWYFGGPHEVQGRSPAHIAALLARAEESGPLTVAISNVQNLRELAVSAEAFAAVALERPADGAAGFLADWDRRYFAAPALGTLHARFFRTFVPCEEDGEGLWLDGFLRAWGLRLLDRMVKDHLAETFDSAQLAARERTLARSLADWRVLSDEAADAVVRCVPQARRSEAWANLVLQARQMAAFSCWAHAVTRAAEAVLERAGPVAVAALDAGIAALVAWEQERRAAATDHFAGWLDNDSKFDLGFMIVFSRRVRDLLAQPEDARDYEPWVEAEHFDYINAYAVKALAE